MLFFGVFFHLLERVIARRKAYLILVTKANVLIMFAYFDCDFGSDSADIAVSRLIYLH